MKQLLLLGLIIATPCAFGATGFLQSEYADGMNKVCVYNVLGSSYTVNVPSTRLCPQTIQAPNPAPRPQPPSYSYTPPSQPYEPPQKTGFLKGEVTRGMNKICFYDVLGSEYTYTVSAVSICPQTRKF